MEQFVESDLDRRIDPRVAPKQAKDDAINAALQTLSVWWREMREEEPPEDLESRMRRQYDEHAKVMEKALKPKTLDEMLEEYDLEMADDQVG